MFNLWRLWPFREDVWWNLGRFVLLLYVSTCMLSGFVALSTSLYLSFVMKVISCRFQNWLSSCITWGVNKPETKPLCDFCHPGQNPHYPRFSSMDKISHTNFQIWTKSPPYLFVNKKCSHEILLQFSKHKLLKSFEIQILVHPVFNMFTVYRLRYCWQFLKTENKHLITLQSVLQFCTNFILKSSSKELARQYKSKWTESV